MKRKFSVIFIMMAFVFSVSFLTSFGKKHTAFAVNSEIENTLNTQSKSVYLIDYNSNTVIYSKNELDKRPIASMCKIMTLILSFEYLRDNSVSLDTEITVSENASGMGGSQVFLEANAQYKINDLLKSIVVASANDASVAMAELVCGSEEAFVIKMNEKAIDLGMKDTNFVNCTGLPKSGQYSCAKDVAIMFKELLQHKDYFKYSNVWLDEIQHKNNRTTTITNTNKLVRFYEGCDAGKTGFTSEAGHCLASSAIRKGMRLVSVIISAPDSKTRFKEATALYNYAFSNYTNKLIVDNGSPLNVNVEVKGGKKNNIEVIAENPIYIFGKMGEKKVVDIEVQLREDIKAPICKGDILGEIKIFEMGNEIASTNILANEDLLKLSFLDCVDRVINNWKIVNL